MRITASYVRGYFNNRVKPIAPLLGLKKYKGNFYVVLKERPDSNTHLKNLTEQKSPKEMFNWLQGFLARGGYKNE